MPTIRQVPCVLCLMGPSAMKRHSGNFSPWWLAALAALTGASKALGDGGSIIAGLRNLEDKAKVVQSRWRHD